MATAASTRTSGGWLAVAETDPLLIRMQRLAESMELVQGSTDAPKDSPDVPGEADRERCAFHLERTLPVRKLPAEVRRWHALTDYVEPVWAELTGMNAPHRMGEMPEAAAMWVHRVGITIAQREATASAELYYATPDFTTLLAGAWPTIPLDSLAGVPPVRTGMVYLQQPLPVAVQGFAKPLLLRTILWDIYPGDDDEPPMLVVFGQAYDQQWNVARTELGKVRVKPGATGANDEDYEVSGTVEVAQIGMAAMLLLQQDNLVETTQSEPSEAATKARGRKATQRDAGRELVKVVRLRRATRKGMDEAHAAERSERHVRWIVRGHWRQQVCGKGRAERRRIYIAPHYKGPEDGTLIVKDTVLQW